MPYQLDGKSIVITGGARGIGAEIAKGLAAEGARIVVADLSADSTKSVVDAIKADGGTAIGFGADVRDRGQVQAMIQAAVAEFGRLDVIFNNAGIAQVQPFLKITEDDWHNVMDVNGLGVLIGMQEAIKVFLAQGGGGKVINTASIAGKQGYDPLAHYCASKWAVVALTQAAARAFGKDKINVNAICPGVVGTEMWKVIDRGFQSHGLSQGEDTSFHDMAAQAVLGRPSVATDLVGVAKFLASPDSDFMTGQSLLVDGGMVFV
ncbi:SDR family NAD(P)-dependent oxidoreductase [Geminicoccus harenae]|uniref:SDR family NAD(P)-dependent oxidoreductase n=1 Tax=Geminicoccus harenae TaxID=2498453 RepID=UPI00168B4536|nr:glucose 1-dehydrogenase [Geminicoccus harenae]